MLCPSSPLETKGHDELKELKRQATQRWVDAVNAEGSFGHWQHVLVEHISDIGALIAETAHTR